MYYISIGKSQLESSQHQMINRPTHLDLLDTTARFSKDLKDLRLTSKNIIFQDYLRDKFLDIEQISSPSELGLMSGQYQMNCPKNVDI